MFRKFPKKKKKKKKRKRKMIFFIIFSCFANFLQSLTTFVFPDLSLSHDYEHAISREGKQCGATCECSQMVIIFSALLKVESSAYHEGLLPINTHRPF
jgi:hypothetical protein